MVALGEFEVIIGKPDRSTGCWTTKPDSSTSRRPFSRSIISLGRSLNLRVIAEGVETKDHEDFLLHEGCDEVQGFRYSKAIPSEEFSSFIESYSGNLSYFDK